jgi:hypothetical protein
VGRKINKKNRKIRNEEDREEGGYQESKEKKWKIQEKK